MSRIAVLPDLLINKIAAGEVIERPASVVRELIDNAIDAGASEINVQVLHGGKKLIRVSDNGYGMSRDDAAMCFERHATSKISSEDDLFDISTLGFRGEALPAIASVSKVTLTTSAPHDDVGVKVEIGADQKRDISDAPPAGGTDVEIRDLFYNTPARRKFLKTNPTELSHIIGTVVNKAFAHPEIAFTLVHNKNIVLNAAPASDRKERFSQLYGNEMADGFVEIRKDSKAVKVTGFISTPDYTRASRSHQTIFVNKRPVKNTTINHAVYHACREVLSKERHPAYFVFLEVDPAVVDVNVHPAKGEVKFERPDDIHRFVGAAVYEALNPGVEIDVSPPSSVKGSGYSSFSGYKTKEQGIPVVSESVPSALNESQTDFFSSGMAQDVSTFFHIGNSFMAKVTDDGIELIDQHAAHERILYEKFLRKVEVESAPLFLPLRIELPVRDYQLIIRHKELLQGFGIDIEDFGSNNIIIRALPQELGKADMKGLIMDISAGILEEATSGIRSDRNDETFLKSIAARIACHKSVRGSEPLNNHELSQMMADLDRTEEPDKCPHGRPTRVTITINDLYKMFKRK